VLLAARGKLAAGKVQIAAQIVNFRERPIGGGRARRHLGFRQRREGVVEFGKQAVGGGNANQRANTVLFRAAVGKRAAMASSASRPRPA
jgi:hypothetical protein